jgi:hypothetical protein
MEDPAAADVARHRGSPRTGRESGRRQRAPASVRRHDRVPGEFPDTAAGAAPAPPHTHAHTERPRRAPDERGGGPNQRPPGAPSIHRSPSTPSTGHRTYDPGVEAFLTARRGTQQAIRFGPSPRRQRWAA